jgi:hypothetical protein
MTSLLAGPTPANGATVTNLYADSNATVKGSDTALVAVIDNTTGATRLVQSRLNDREPLLEHHRIGFCGGW